MSPNIELRWLMRVVKQWNDQYATANSSAQMVRRQPVLQYRTASMDVMRGYVWSEWQDVPIEAES